MLTDEPRGSNNRNTVGADSKGRSCHYSKFAETRTFLFNCIQRCQMTTSKKPWNTLEASGRSFIKMQGLRNHFVIVDGRDESYEPDTPEVVNICDPQTGIGADQLVIIESPRTDGVYAFMRLLNVDGRDVEACGNATRCVAWLLMEEASTDSIRIETLAGVLECHRKGDMQVSCDMGKISMEWQTSHCQESKIRCT